MRTLKRFPYITDDLIDAYSYGGSITSSSLRLHLQIQKEEPIAAYVLRKHFDQGLVNQAVQSGATFRDQTTAETIQRTNDTIQLRSHDGEILESHIIIGADGIWIRLRNTQGYESRTRVSADVSSKNIPWKTPCLINILPRNDVSSST